MCIAEKAPRTGSRLLEVIKKMRVPTRIRTIAMYGTLGFAVQQIVAMGLGSLGIVHSHYDVELGPHTIGWPAPPDRLDRLWINWVGPTMFPMPDSGTGDDGDRGASSGLQEDDRAQQLPFVARHREKFFIVWRATRGRLLGRPFGEQWAVVGPIDSMLLDAFRGFNERYGAPSEPAELFELRAMVGQRERSIRRGAPDDRAQSDVEYAREQTAREEFEAGRMLESEVFGIARRHELRRAVDAYLRAFGPIKFESPPSLWNAEQAVPTDSLAKSPNQLMLRTSAEWGWPMPSVHISAGYEWNGTFGLQSATALFTALFKDEEDESYDALQEEAWQAELCALVSAVPKLRQDGKPLWTRVQQDWIPLPDHYISADHGTFLPGAPWRPLWVGGLLNSAMYALSLWCVWSGLVRRMGDAWRTARARRAKRCATCGYPTISVHPGMMREARCPECGARLV